MAYNLDDLDQHMANLRSTLRFFTDSLERTDHNSPDWLAPDLISLRNQSGRLQESMQNFRAQLLTTGLAEKKVTPPSRASALVWKLTSADPQAVEQPSKPRRLVPSLPRRHTFTSFATSTITGSDADRGAES
ncbi:hypothetical protein GRF29_44g213973 [Pseudopithomyces chartarum]|uniref:Uncharacterized protein n=1 Tax=Pseudopithomyces chartarum TaxID=1892770 RepID=A0AAN6LXL4_9PLEO|nr:hypothetical protein GRF29_44g213973 [Pseudopithomyces chartarum]